MLDLLINEHPSEVEISASLSGFVNRVQRVLYRWNVAELTFDPDRLAQAHEHSMLLLHRYLNPSCFKAAAAMTLGVVSAKPFEFSLPEQFGDLKTKTNSVFGVLESVYWMHDAELKIDSGLKILSQPIEFSDHYFSEFVSTIDALAWPTALPATDFSPEYHARFRILALAYEALAYQKNGHCKYLPPRDLRLDEYFSNIAQ